MIRAGHLLVAGLAGFAILVLEFAAVRLLAPAFGQSGYVWANVIGVILLALALGYVAGGRLGERSRSGRPLYLGHGLAGLWIAATAALGHRFCALLVPTGLPGDGGLPLGFTGSLVATLVLFAPPAFLLALTGPFLIRLEARRGSEGRATGAIYAVGTLGSLVGCFAGPLWMLQVLGTSTTLYAVAAAALLPCLLGSLMVRGGRSDAQAEAPPSSAGLGPVQRSLLGAALVAGWATTVLEFGAVRFMSPWFGQSNHIWANIIGLSMLALALGSWIGGRWADATLARGPVGERGFIGALAVAALAVALAVWIGPTVLEELMPTGIDSLRLLPIADAGSRVAALLFFGLPMLLLGAAPPFLVRMAAAEGHAGRAAGALFSASTVGGLVGCFTTASLLVPLIGSRGALLLAAGCVGVLAWAFLRRSAGAGPGSRVVRPLAWAAVALPLALGVHQIVERPALRVHEGQVVEIESAYQTIRVVRERLAMGAPNPLEALVPANLPYGQEADTFFLRHDEDAETYQSVYVRDEAQRAAWLTGGRYFEHMAIGAFFARTEVEKPLRVLIIGYAGGTVHRTLRQTWGGDLDVLGVEIDPAVLEVARRHLGHEELTHRRPGHPGDRLRLLTNEDARTVVNALPAEEMFDLVLVDAYTRTNYVPFQLASVEFFEHVRDHLAPDGWLGVNVLGHGFRGPVARAVASTMGHVYGSCYAAPNPAYPGNVILWTQPGAVRGPRILRNVEMHPGMHIAAFAIERYLVRHDPETDGGVVLTDDKSPSDRLADKELGL